MIHLKWLNVLAKRGMFKAQSFCLEGIDAFQSHHSKWCLIDIKYYIVG